MKQENLKNIKIAYMRNVGEYGSNNHELMETFKAFLSEHDLFDMKKIKNHLCEFLLPLKG